MIKHNQDGAVNGLLVSLILTVLLLFGAVGFGFWAYGQRQDYKDNVDAKISAASEVARQNETDVKTKEFNEKQKDPLKTYNGPEAAGSLLIRYPKTWSGYVDDKGNGNATVDAYFSAGVVPAINDQTSVFALRVQVIHQPYAQVLQTFSGQLTAGKLKASAYTLPKLPKVVGVLLSGQLSDKTNITMVVLPLRGDTLEISTEGDQYLSDFNTHILPNFSFSP